MTAPAMLDHTKVLPTELRHIICELLPQDDQKHVRFVNKAWSSAAGTALWKTFSTDLSEGPTRMIDTLLRSKDVLAMIKKLHLRGDDIQSCHTLLDLGRAYLLVQLLCALPRNNLRAFTSNFLLDRRTVGLILKSQTKLSEIIFPHQVLDDYYLEGNVDKLTDLTLELHKAVTKVRTNCLAFTTALRSLAIGSTARDAHNGKMISVFSMPKLQRPLSLRNLEICSTTIRNKEGSFGGMTDLSKLQSLLLSNCPGIAVTMEYLAKEFLECEISALKSLIVRQTSTTNAEKPFHTELQTLLEAVPALETLCVTAIKAKLLPIDTICRHGRSLRYLHVDHFPNLHEYISRPLNKVERYTPQELEKLVSSCPNIEGLSLNLVGWDFGDFDIDEIFALGETTWNDEGIMTIDSLLLPISRLRNIRNLRLTHPLIHPEDGHNDNFIVLKYQSRCQQVANAVMEFLVNNKSPIELLAFGPGYWPHTIFPSDSYRDLNGHKIPHFYYRRGIATVSMRGGKQISRALAVPVREESEHEEMLFWK